MHHPALVRLLERLGDLAGDRQRVGNWQRRLSHPGLQRFSDDMLHHDAGAPVDLGELVDVADVGVVERRGRPRLAVQPLARLGVCFERRGQELDRDLAAKLCVVGQEHLAHTASTEAVEEGVAGGRQAHLALRASGFGLWALRLHCFRGARLQPCLAGLPASATEETRPGRSLGGHGNIFSGRTFWITTGARKNAASSRTSRSRYRVADVPCPVKNGTSTDVSTRITPRSAAACSRSPARSGRAP